MKNVVQPASTRGKLTETLADPSAADGSGFRSWVLMISERKWYAISVFIAISVATAIYTLVATPQFEAVTTVQVLKRGAQVMRVVDVVETSVTSDTDFITQIKILESISLAQNTANRLTPQEIEELTAPFKSAGGESSPVEIIFRGRKIQPQRFSLMVAIRFQHPSAKMAARIANLLASEYIAYNRQLRVDESMKAVDELKERAELQRKRVDEAASALQSFRQRGNLISLVQSKDIVTERLKTLNLMATQSGARLKEAEIRWQQVQDWRKNGRNLAELPYIATQPKVNQLNLQITAQKLALEGMRDRYKPRHPQWIEVSNSLAKAESEMTEAVKSATASVEAEYLLARDADEAARKSLADQEVRSLELDRSAVEYDNLSREFRVNEQLLESMLARMREASVSSSIETESARIIDRAGESRTPVSPKVAMNIGLGLAAGLILGLAVAYLIAMIDDRIKTIFDIETMVGLPLVGIVPRVNRMSQPDKAQIVFNGEDRPVLEAFLGVYSNLRLNDQSRAAKLVMITSTQPGEGKSFVATNLALTFASQGQRTLIVDCDLRKPTVQGSFRLESSKGLTGYCLHHDPLADVVVENVHPNLDVVVAGPRPRNPVQVFNSKEFEEFVAEVARKYDRVVFDTPPVGVVSDALNILPIMDGAIYVIRFNGVDRRLARRHARNLMATSIPLFGAVFNDANVGATGSYYVDQNTKIFKEYYAGGPAGVPESKPSEESKKRSSVTYTTAR